HLDHFLVQEQGKLETITPKAPVEEGKVMELQLVEVGLHDPTTGVAKVEGFDVCIADAARLVGKKVKVQIVRVLPNGAYGTIVSTAKPARAPITAEGEAEKPTRVKPVTKKETDGAIELDEDEVLELDEDEVIELAGAEVLDPDEPDDDELEPDEEEEEGELESDEPEDAVATDGAAPVKRKTRRGSRGGRRRKKPTGVTAPTSTSTEIALRQPATNGGEPPAPRIYVPSSDFGRDGQTPQAPKVTPEAEAVATEASGNGAAADDGAAPVKKKTRRGSRGGKNRRKKPAGATTDPAATEPGESS
ncbi:MAG: hypothetical protein QOE91_2011, partial [Gaiellaceae bacterium]|nr:hypothetical protein [Gaiellaceae bacterium]